MRLTSWSTRPFLLAVCVALVVSGCASYPVSQDLRQEAQPLTIAQVAANPGAAVGKVVIWGGSVIQTLNESNGADIYILSKPLAASERPKDDSASNGRFIAHHDGFVDPEEFKNGKLVTVAGKITGVRTESLQKIRYTYPVIDMDEVHVWRPLPPPQPYYPLYPYDYGPEWGYEMYGPFWFDPAWPGGWYGGAAWGTRYHGGGDGGGHGGHR